MDDIFKEALRSFAPEGSSVHLASQPASAVIGHPAAESDAQSKIDALRDRCAQLEHNSRLAADRIRRLESDLNECREFLDGQIDVVDGDYGEPSPNRAMVLCSMIDETLGDFR